MQYLITFLEGIISFISPCMLPMLPVYISYFAGGQNKKHRTFVTGLMFVLGFTAVFCVLGLFAGTLGSFLRRYQTVLNIVCGAVVIVMGLGFLDIIRLPFFSGMKGGFNSKNPFSAFLFGMVFSVSLTPCTGAFLGSALMMASTSGTALRGMGLLLTYSLGMGVPFLISAVLTEKLSSVFGAVRKHYKIINPICGGFLIIVGILMMLGLLNKFLGLFV